MSFIQEFKAFIMRGNVIDLAVGVIIGGAFGKIVSSFVSDVVMPPIGLIMGGVNFKDLQLILKPATVAADGSAIAPVAVNYGLFIQNVVDFLIVALVIFMVIQAVNRLHKPAPAAPAPEVPAEQKILTEIRDILRTKAPV